MTEQNKNENSQKIVIVIGAGASCDFSDSNSQEKDSNLQKNHAFPSGEALVKMIANQQKIFGIIDNKFKYNLKKMLYSPYQFISRLVTHYQPFSIDELLNSIKRDKIDILSPLGLKDKDLPMVINKYNSEFLSHDKSNIQPYEQFKNDLISAGKTLIAIFLLRSEKAELFENNCDAKIWYRHIRNLIISGKDDSEIYNNISNLTIISFNYDRSLDYYLRTRLSKYYSKIKERIIYPYGKLANDKQEDSKDDKDFEDSYGKFDKGGEFAPYSFDEIKKFEELGKGLRVIGELDDVLIIDDEIKNKLNEDYNQMFKPVNFSHFINSVNNTMRWKENLKDYTKYIGKKGSVETIVKSFSKDWDELTLFENSISKMSDSNEINKIIILMIKKSIIPIMLQAPQLIA